MSAPAPPRGVLVALEGPEGAGKSTQLPPLAARLEAAGRRVTVTREPGGTPPGERIRGLLLDPEGGPMDGVTEALLFGAARAALMRRVIAPALAEGQVVVTDRFTDSTLAYQGYGRGLPLDALRAINRLATDGRAPDLVVLLDLPSAEGLARRRRAGGLDRLDGETRAFHERVAAGYRQLADADPARWRVVDAAADAEAVAEALWRVVAAAVGVAAPPPGA